MLQNAIKMQDVFYHNTINTLHVFSLKVKVILSQLFIIVFDYLFILIVAVKGRMGCGSTCHVPNPSHLVIQHQ